MTGRESSLFDFAPEIEKLYCGFCKSFHNVVEQKELWVHLKCGHVTTRELSESEQKNVALHMDLGWPNPDGGWYKSSDKDYPGPNEMAVKIKHYPQIVDKIRKLLGNPEWEP